jgi:hypothetical protein
MQNKDTEIDSQKKTIDSLQQKINAMNDLINKIGRAYNISDEDLEVLKGQTDLLSQMQDRVDEEVKGRSR